MVDKDSKAACSGILQLELNYEVLQRLLATTAKL
jgi:hypothetical protein